ncbi:hypothetical protein BGZ92_007132 [Podila epicladia]|nr:hypothetical protein BGZ92_007132 [Podila epicladia]
MSMQELRQLKRLNATELNSPRKLRERRQLTLTAGTNAHVSKEYQDRVFSIPELQSCITTYLTGKDLKVSMLTCQAWFEFCAPALYKDIFLKKYKRTKAYPKIYKYGQYVQVLRLNDTNVHGVLHMLDNTPRLRQLDLSNSFLSRAELERVLTAVPDQLASLQFRLRTPELDDEKPWHPEPMLHTVSLVHNLRSLLWSAPGMTVHVDDILRVLHACPHLVSIKLEDINIVYQGFDSFVPLNGRKLFEPDPPGPLVPIPDSDVDTFYSGNKLQCLTLEYVYISDEGLLHLLGIDMESVHVAHHRISPALIHLTVKCYGPTYKSGARILQECHHLETFDIEYTRMASLELFQGDTIWPSAPFIKKLCLDFKSFGMDPKGYFRHLAAVQAQAPVFSAQDQRQIWMRLRSMVNLECLRLSGYPIDLSVIEDMSFATELKSASVWLTVRALYEDISVAKDALLNQVQEWLKNNPRGWDCSFIGVPWPPELHRLIFSFLDENILSVRVKVYKS